MLPPRLWGFLLLPAGSRHCLPCSGLPPHGASHPTPCHSSCSTDTFCWIRDPPTDTCPLSRLMPIQVQRVAQAASFMKGS